MSGPRISAELLKCEEHNLALVLDVLNRDSTNLKQFEKVCIVTCYTSIARLHNTLVCGFIEESWAFLIIFGWQYNLLVFHKMVRILEQEVGMLQP